MTKRVEIMLLIRELVNNRRRAEHVNTWCLTDSLGNLIEVAKAGPGVGKHEQPTDAIVR